jgi:hypothetical protein
VLDVSLAYNFLVPSSSGRISPKNVPNLLETAELEQPAPTGPLKRKVRMHPALLRLNVSTLIQLFSQDLKTYFDVLNPNLQVKFTTPSGIKGNHPEESIRRWMSFLNQIQRNS